MTKLPDDPKFVLAMRVTEKSYDHYLKLPAQVHLEKEKMLDSIIFVPVDQPLDWGHVDRETFDRWYKPVEDWIDGRYTFCIPND